MNENHLERDLRTLITRSTGQDISRVGWDADLVAELGLDSLASLSLLAAIERHFDFRFPDEKLSDLRTLRKIHAEIEVQRKGDLP